MEGRACSNARISLRRLRFPQANSPITIGWHATSPLNNNSAKASLPLRRWSTHTEVSTSIIYGILRRGIGRKPRSDPPNLASLDALSRAIRASSPMWTRAVFLLTPVKAEALESKSSLMMMVVLMHMNTPYKYAYVKANVTGERMDRPPRARRTLHPVVRNFLLSVPL